MESPMIFRMSRVTGLKADEFPHAGIGCELGWHHGLSSLAAGGFFCYC